MKKNLIKISELKPYDLNHKDHPEEQIVKIAKSILEFGFRNPVIITSKKEIIAGHGRILAMDLLKEKHGNSVKVTRTNKEGLEYEETMSLISVPYVKVDNLSENKIKAYRIADNRTAEESEWLNEYLKEDMEYLQNHDYDLEMTGFDIDEIDSILNFDYEDKIEVESHKRSKSKTKIKRGEIFKLANNRLMCGDATSKNDVEKLLDGKKARTIYHPFGSPGISLIACLKLEKKCYMMESDVVYCQEIIDRWEKHTSLKAEKVIE